MAKRHQVRQRIKARYDHLDKSRYGEDILGLKPAKLCVHRSSLNPAHSSGVSADHLGGNTESIHARRFRFDHEQRLR